MYMYIHVNSKGQAWTELHVDSKLHLTDGVRVDMKHDTVAIVDQERSREAMDVLYDTNYPYVLQVQDVAGKTDHFTSTYTLYVVCVYYTYNVILA